MALVNAPTRTRGDRLAERRGSRRGFTLVEMLVSLAVLTLALSAVGVIFAVTTKTTSQAAAYAEVQVLVRQFMTRIKDDLSGVDPSESILVMVGRTQAAARTADDLAAGKFHRVRIGDPSNVSTNYDPDFDANDPVTASNDVYSNPRADLLMFFTNQPVVSQAPPTNPNDYPGDPEAHAALAGVKFSPTQVVYGHAALSDPLFDGSNYYVSTRAADWTHIEQNVGSGAVATDLSKIPANNWHLARRQAIMLPTIDSRYDGSYTPLTWLGGIQRLVNCVPDAQRRPEEGPGGMGGTSSMPGDATWVNVPLLLSQFDSDRSWFASAPAAVSPYFSGGAGGIGSLPSWDPNMRNLISNLMFRDGVSDQYHHVATVLREVPVELRGNTGNHLLPGCAWFQVEFLMPEDPRNSREYVSPYPTNVNYSRPSDVLRWTTIKPNTPNDSTYFFAPDTAANRNLVAQQFDAAGRPTDRLATFARMDQDPSKDNTGEDVLTSRKIRMWPYAIRVTVHVYDERGRLDQPIVRSVVHRFD